MKRASILLVTILCPAALADAGWYGPTEESMAAAGFYAQYYDYDLATEVSPEFGGNFLLLGGRVYHALNDWLRFGLLGGASFTVNGTGDDDVTREFGLGAVTLEPYLSWEWLYVSAPVAVGFGGYKLQHVLEKDEDLHRYTMTLYESGFFFVEPTLEVGLRLIPFTALALRGGYHWHYDGDRGRGDFFFGGAFLFGMP